MTKYKTLKRSTFAIIALSLVLVAVLAFGGTYAYFSASADGTTGTGKLGTLTVTAGTATGVTTATTVIVPNEQILSQQFTITGDMNYYVRFGVKVNVTGMSGTKGAAEPEANAVIVLSGLENLVSSSDSVTLDTVKYYYVATSATAATKVTGTNNYTPVATINKLVGANASTYYMGATVSVSITCETVQADYLASSTEEGTAMSVSDLEAAWDTIVDSTYGA